MVFFLLVRSYPIDFRLFVVVLYGDKVITILILSVI